MPGPTPSSRSETQLPAHGNHGGSGGRSHNRASVKAFNRRISGQLLGDNSFSSEKTITPSNPFPTGFSVMSKLQEFLSEVSIPGTERTGQGKMEGGWLLKSNTESLK